ncbi:Hypothetical protein POVR1_LOCUS138 [uncultured virus]|nr:Hypothetical protein POVR1_LOCUS138 [uncultured virus]
MHRSLAPWLIPAMKRIAYYLCVYDLSVKIILTDFIIAEMDRVKDSNEPVLPIDLQYQILKESHEGIRVSRLLNKKLRKAFQYDQIDLNILSVPLVSEIEDYLTQCLPLNFNIFYHHRTTHGDLYGKLMHYRYRSDVYGQGYANLFEVIIRLESDNITINSMEETEIESHSINTLAQRGRVAGDEFIVYQHCYIISRNSTCETHQRDFKANVLYYDLLTIRYVIEKRLQSLETPAKQMKRLTNQYLIRYLDDIVLNVTIQTYPFVYYFVVSSAHLLAISTPREMTRYFPDSDINYISNAEDPNIVEMQASINRLHPMIIKRLESI